MVNFGRILFSSLLEMNRAWSTADGYRCSCRRCRRLYIFVHIYECLATRSGTINREITVFCREMQYLLPWGWEKLATCGPISLYHHATMWHCMSSPSTYTHTLISIQCKTATNTEERQHLSHHLFSSQHRLQVYTCCKVLILNNTYYIILLLVLHWHVKPIFMNY